MNCADLPDVLHSYLDGELQSVQSKDVETHLYHCRECTASYAREHALSTAIKRDVRRYSAPRALRDRIRLDVGARWRRAFGELRCLGRGWNPVTLAASLLLAVAASSIVTSSYLGASSEGRIVEDIISSHIRSLTANHLTDVASSKQQTLKSWFAGKVDALPRAVDLASTGFPLMGGRLDYVDQRPCAVLVYRHDDHIIDVLVWANKTGGPTSSEFYTREGYNLARFAAGNLSFWAVADLNRAELHDFVTRLETEVRIADTPS